MGPVEDLEILRRSLVMLPSGAPSGLTRDQAITLMEDLQKARRRIIELEQELQQLSLKRHPANKGQSEACA